LDKVFRVELATDKRRYCELELPASPYELLDALEKLQMTPGEKPEWEFIENHNFHFLDVHLSGECDLYQLNALATRLSELDSTGRIAFEGMFNQEVAKKYGPITIATMVDLAYSTDCCHVVEGVNTDTKLGEFYAENGFMSHPIRISTWCVTARMEKVVSSRSRASRRSSPCLPERSSGRR